MAARKATMSRLRSRCTIAQLVSLRGPASIASRHSPAGRRLNRSTRPRSVNPASSGPAMASAGTRYSSRIQSSASRPTWPSALSGISQSVQAPGLGAARRQVRGRTRGRPGLRDREAFFPEIVAQDETFADLRDCRGAGACAHDELEVEGHRPPVFQARQRRPLEERKRRRSHVQRIVLDAQRHGLRRRICGVRQHAENEERQTRQKVRPRARVSE